MLKVTLVNPPTFSGYPQPPMGLIQLAAVLKEVNIPVEIIDANALNLTPSEIVPLLQETDLLGLTAMTPTVATAFEIAREAKNVYPDLPIVLGGPHATLLPRETFEASPDIDILVKGEGEEPLYRLVSAISNNDSIDDVPGILWEVDGTIVENDPPDEPIDPENLPFLAYDLIPLEHYRPHPPHGRAMPFAVLITSRGCPYNCAYCSKPVFGRKFRAQSPERVVAEIVDLQQKYGVKEIAFYDDVFTLDQERAYAISEAIVRQNLKVTWSCETRVNLVDRELLAIMRRAGCYSISYGLESGSQEILNTVNKNTTLEQAEKAVYYTRQAGIHAIGYFMVGSPGETPETIRETIDFAKRLKLDFAQFSVTVPFPGTELHDYYLEAGGRNDIPWEDYVYVGSGKGTPPVFSNENLSREDIMYWQRKAYREFYLRPSYIWQRLMSCRSIGDIRINVNGLFMLTDSLTSSKKER